MSTDKESDGSSGKAQASPEIEQLLTRPRLPRAARLPKSQRMRFETGPRVIPLVKSGAPNTGPRRPSQAEQSQRQQPSAALARFLVGANSVRRRSHSESGSAAIDAAIESAKRVKVSSPPVTDEMEGLESTDVMAPDAISAVPEIKVAVPLKVPATVVTPILAQLATPSTAVTPGLFFISTSPGDGTPGSISMTSPPTVKPVEKISTGIVEYSQDLGPTYEDDDLDFLKPGAVLEDDPDRVYNDAGDDPEMLFSGDERESTPVPDDADIQEIKREDMPKKDDQITPEGKAAQEERARKIHAADEQKTLQDLTARAVAAENFQHKDSNLGLFAQIMRGLAKLRAEYDRGLDQLLGVFDLPDTYTLTCFQQSINNTGISNEWLSAQAIDWVVEASKTKGLVSPAAVYLPCASAAVEQITYVPPPLAGQDDHTWVDARILALPSDPEQIMNGFGEDDTLARFQQLFGGGGVNAVVFAWLVNTDHWLTVHASLGVKSNAASIYDPKGPESMWSKSLQVRKILPHVLSAIWRIGEARVIDPGTWRVRSYKGCTKQHASFECGMLTAINCVDIANGIPVTAPTLRVKYHPFQKTVLQQILARVQRALGDVKMQEDAPGKYEKGGPVEPSSADLPAIPLISSGRDTNARIKVLISPGSSPSSKPPASTFGGGDFGADIFETPSSDGLFVHQDEDFVESDEHSTQQSQESVHSRYGPDERVRRSKVDAPKKTAPKSRPPKPAEPLKSKTPKPAEAVKPSSMALEDTAGMISNAGLVVSCARMSWVRLPNPAVADPIEYLRDSARWQYEGWAVTCDARCDRQEITRESNLDSMDFANQAYWIRVATIGSSSGLPLIPIGSAAERVVNLLTLADTFSCMKAEPYHINILFAGLDGLSTADMAWQSLRKRWPNIRFTMNCSSDVLSTLRYRDTAIRWPGFSKIKQNLWRGDLPLSWWKRIKPHPKNLGSRERKVEVSQVLRELGFCNRGAISWASFDAATLADPPVDGPYSLFISLLREIDGLKKVSAVAGAAWTTHILKAVCLRRRVAHELKLWAEYVECRKCEVCGAKEDTAGYFERGGRPHTLVCSRCFPIQYLDQPPPLRAEDLYAISMGHRDYASKQKLLDWLVERQIWLEDLNDTWYSFADDVSERRKMAKIKKRVEDAWELLHFEAGYESRLYRGPP